MLVLEEVLVWLVVVLSTLVAFGLGLVWWQRHRRVGRAVRLPGIFLLLGAVVLLLTDQGRDLGAALLDAVWYQHVFFAAALLFWSIVTWHSGRIALEQVFGRDPQQWGEEKGLILWLPRAQGGLVFVIAAANLAFAAASAGAWGRFAILSALIVGTGGGYALAVIHRRKIGAWLADRMPWYGQVEAGYDCPDTTALRRATKGFIAGFFCVSIATAGSAWFDPWALGETMGAVAIGFFAFGAFLAILATARLMPEAWHRPVIVAVLAVAIVTELSRNYHPVRLWHEAPEAAAAAIAARPDVGTAAIAWYDAARAADPTAEALPMLVIATAGGGLRAAYWTAVVLDDLQQALGLDDHGRSRLQNHLFAVSGVSGGSVGATFFSAMAPDFPDPAAHGPAVKAALARDFLAPTLAALAFVDLPSLLLPDLGQPSRGEALEVAFERASGRDGSTPLAAPFLQLRDSAGGAWRPLLLLNATHQESGRRLIASHVTIDQEIFLDAFDLHVLAEADIRASTAAHNSARFTYVSPAGALRNLHGERRGHVIDGGYFENFGAVTAAQLARAALVEIDLHRMKSGPDMGPPVIPLLVQISSDPDLLERDRVQLGDADACRIATAGPMTFMPTSGWLWWEEAGDDGGRISWANQLVAPLKGIMATRGAHGLLASKSLAQATCDIRDRLQDAVFAHFSMCDDASPPLGWALSAGSREAIESFLGQCGNAAVRGRVLEVFGIDSDAVPVASAD